MPNYFVNCIISYYAIGLMNVLKKILKSLYFLLLPFYRLYIKKIIKFFDYHFGYCIVYSNIPYYLLAPMPKGGETLLKKGCQELKKSGYTFFLTGGTLLGIYRDGKLIAHDTDIDVDIIGPVDEQKLDAIFTKKLKLTLGLKITYRKKAQQLVYYSKNNTTFDLHCWEVDGDWAENKTHKHLIWRHSMSFYRKLSHILFDGYNYPIPDKVEEFLTFVYGKTWRTPSTAKPTPFADRFDIIKR